MDQASGRKLVRDNDPERVLTLEHKRMNVVPAADDAEFRFLLCAKLLEETGEFQRAPSADELGDIATVLDFIYAAYAFDPELVRSLRRGRCHKTGVDLHIDLVGQAHAFRTDQLIEQLADFLEMFDVICASSPDFAPERVEAARLFKRDARGEFYRRLVWDFTFAT